MSAINQQDKVAIITGAANGLGKALAKEYCRQGCHLALIDTDQIGLEQLQSELQRPHLKITIHRADVSIENEIISARRSILGQHGRVDILINNAGISISQPFSEISLEDFRKLIDVNFWGAVYCTKYFLSDLQSRDSSRIVNIISGFALMGFPGKSAYSSSKAAIMGFTNSLQTELAGSNVKVCLVIPPALDTGLIRNSIHISARKREREAAFIEKNAMPVEIAARKIIRGIAKGKYRITVGSMMLWIDVIARFFPTTIHTFIAKNKKHFDFI